MKPLLVLGMHGLGDNLFQRPFVRAESERREVYLSTPWPEIYEDLPVKFIRPARQYRTQIKNTDRQSDERWAKRIPRDREAKGFWYGLKKPDDNPFREFEKIFPLDGPPKFDLPDFGPSPVQSDKPVAVIRPVTRRKEWENLARNCKPEYVNRAAQILHDLGWHVVSVADVNPPHEVFVGDPPYADEAYHGGELTIKPLLSLVQHADLVVGPVGWIVPGAIAARTPLIIIGGGMGGNNAPEKITDPRMHLDTVRFILPQPYCRCTQMRHDCPREVPDFEARFRRAVDAVAPVMA